MKLQVNTSGAWRDFIAITPEQREGVVAAAQELARQVRAENGAGVKWCIVHDDGRREWIEEAV